MPSRNCRIPSCAELIGKPFQGKINPFALSNVLHLRGKMKKLKTKRSAFGLIHTRHFGTQYCDKKILQYKIFLSHRFQYPTRVSSEKNVTYLEQRAYLGQKKPVALNYLFIAISF